jgi:NADH-quinone oxidoreductase subunit C
MTPKEIFAHLVARAGADTVFGFEDEGGAGAVREAGFHVRPADVAGALSLLRDDPALRFDFLQNLTAVDWPKRAELEVVYHLFSYVHRHAVCVRVALPRDVPRVPSVAAVWPTANWLEREQYDLLGVVFEGHPDLRRLLMPDDWIGHPMRKDFREPKSYRGMPTSRPSPLDLLQTYDRAHVARPTHAAPPTPAPGGPAGAGEPKAPA